MRPSVIAIVALLACAGAGYAYVEGALPPSLQSRIDGALAALNLSGGNTRAASAKPTTPARPRAVQVETSIATAASPVMEIASIGSLRADESVTLATEQEGRIVSIDFEEGQAKKAGDRLVKLDDTLLAAQVDDLKARLDLADQNFNRADTLSNTGAGTARARDEARSQLIIAQAALNLLESRLAKTTISAPFDGVMGLRSVSVGAFLQVGDTIATIEKLDRVKIDFNVPEKNLADIAVGYPIEVKVDAYPDRTFRGEIYAIDPQIDVNGRALKVRGRLDNPGGVLRPGLFARVIVKGASRGDVVMVPEAAIVPNGADLLIYRVMDGKAAETKVRLGQRGDGLVEVLDGIAAGDTVVTSGQARLRNGAVIEAVTASGDPVGTTKS